MNAVGRLIFMVVIVLASGFIISNAAKAFKESKWFIFGVHVACAVWELAYLVKLIFEF